MIMMSDYDDDEYVGHGHDDGDDGYENDGGHDDNGHGHGDNVKKHTDCYNHHHRTIQHNKYLAVYLSSSPSTSTSSP